MRGGDQDYDNFSSYYIDEKHDLVVESLKLAQDFSAFDCVVSSSVVHCNLDIVKNLVSGVYFTICTFFTIQPVFCFKMKILSAPHFYYIKVFYYSAVYYIQVRVYMVSVYCSAKTYKCSYLLTLLKTP